MKITKAMIRLARAHDACPEALEWLAAHPDSDLSDLPEEFRLWVARNPAPPPHILEALSGDTSEDVRRDTAFNPATPTHILEVLSADAFECVRFNAVTNPATPTHVRARVPRQGREYVRGCGRQPGHARAHTRGPVWGRDRARAL